MTEKGAAAFAGRAQQSGRWSEAETEISVFNQKVRMRKWISRRGDGGLKNRESDRKKERKKEREKNKQRERKTRRQRGIVNGEIQ